MTTYPTGAGNGTLPVAYNESTGISSGFRSTTYTDPATAGSQAQFAADDFVLSSPTQISSLSVDLPPRATGAVGDPLCQRLVTDASAIETVVLARCLDWGIDVNKLVADAEFLNEVTSQCGDTVALGRMVSGGDQGDVRFPRLV